MGLLSKEMIADLIINIVNILVLFFVVKALLYKPVKKYLDGRKEKVASVQDEAARKVTEADEMKAQYEKLLSDSETLRLTAESEAQTAAKADAEKILSQARHDADSIVSGAKEKMKNEHDKMIADAKDELTDIAVEISGKLIGRSITDEDNRRIVDSFFAEKAGTV